MQRICLIGWYWALKHSSWEQFQCFTPLKVLPHSTQKKTTKNCIENSTKKWMHRWNNDLCSCKIRGCTKFCARREEWQIGIWIGAGYGSIWIVHPTQLIYPFYLFCFSLHGILFNPKFCMNIDPCIIYASIFWLNFRCTFWLFFFWVECGSHFKGGEALELLSGRCFRAQYQPTRQIHCNLCVVPDLVMIITLSGTGSQRSCSLRFLNSFNILWFK